MIHPNRRDTPAVIPRIPVFAVGLLLLAVFVPGLPAADRNGDLAFFESKIRPVLVDHCYRCHSQEAQDRGKLKAGLLLDTRAGLLQGGESGPAVVPGKPDASLLLRSLRHEKNIPAMPPGKELPKEVVADFAKWIRRGLPDPREGNPIAVKKGMSVEAGRTFWAFQPPAPAADLRSGKTTEVIDRLILAGLRKRDLVPNEPADRSHLIRRLTFDLTGLPPTPDEVEAFVRDRSPDASARVVDRLLASPHFGERWGRHWLDAVRYADSNGRDRNILWYHAWRYRDYVIQAVNDDIPYDRFVQEQVAGDLLPAGLPAERDRLRIATGFWALGPKAFEELKPEVYRMDVIDEQIDVLSRSILGLSVACARCHDHKFDPIPTRDYYALAGILRSTQPLYGLGTLGIKATMHHHSPLWPVGPDAERLGESGLAFLREVDRLTLVQNTARSDRYRIVRRLADAKLKLTKADADRESLQADIQRMEAEIKEWDQTVKKAEEAVKAAQENPPAMPDLAMGARDRAQPEDCKIHIRGETAQLGPLVPRGIPAVFPNRLAPIPEGQSGRRQLADWLTDRGNPLTARVQVNRIWLHLFGRGLVASPDDFGVTGSPPSHTELLDFLAVRFMDEGWSTKKLIRAVVLSRTYQRSAVAQEANLARDPDNLHLWRMSPRVLEAEAFRDAVLALSGRLQRRPPEPRAQFLARYNPYAENEYRNFKPIFLPDQIDAPHRSIYLPVVRGVLPTMFQLFDFASPDRPIAQREQSIVPAQSLYLMNNPWMIDQARHTARDLLGRPGLSDPDRVDLLFRRAYARPASPDEQERIRKYLAEPEAVLPPIRGKPAPTELQLREERWVSFCQAILAGAEFRTLR